MTYDEFVSFMADYNQKLYPNHNNMWRKINLIDSANLNARTTKSFLNFKSHLSKNLQNFSREDIEKLLITPNGPRPHPNTFILKKLGISPATYRTIRYAIFNHTRYAYGNNPDNLVPLAAKDNSAIKNISDEIVPVEPKETCADFDEYKKDVEMQIQQLQNQIDKIKHQIEEMDYILNYYAVPSLKKIKRSTDNLQEDIKHQLQEQTSDSAALSFFMGALGSGGVILLNNLIGKNKIQNPTTNLEDRINWISQNIIQIEQSLQAQSQKIQSIFGLIHSMRDLTNGFNYLRLFGVPITKKDWESLSDDIRNSWSPFHIKPPLTEARRKAIAESIKRNEPPTVEMCYDLT